MTGAIAAISWLVENWSLIATCFSSLASIALFFMHGTNKAQLQELKDFINSVHMSKGPEDAKAVAEALDPKV